MSEELARLEQRRDELESLQEAIAAKRAVCPNDYGVRVWWGFVLIGILVGWMRSGVIASILLYGAAFWIVGMFFCIFAVDSAEVQSKVAVFLNRRGMRRVATWLYTRALTIR